MDKFYGVLNTRTGRFVPFEEQDTNLTEDVEEAKEIATRYNLAMKPAYQTFTVVTVTFDKEV